MNHLIQKFGFINETQFLSVTKTMSKASGNNLNNLRYKFVKEKGFETVKSYLLALSKESQTKEKIGELEINIESSFEKSSFLKERKIIYLTEDSIYIEIPVYKKEITNVELFYSVMSENISNTTLLSGGQLEHTEYDDILIFSGEFLFKDILNNHVNIENFSSKLNDIFYLGSGFSLYIDHLSHNVDPGYIGIAPHIIDYPSFKTLKDDIDIKYKKIIADAFFYGRIENKKLIEFRKKFLQQLIINTLEEHNK